MITSSGRNPSDYQGDGAARTAARAVATELYTLGGVRVLQQGSPLDVNLGSRHLALLIFLFHERRPMHPLEVVEMLGHGQDHSRELDGLKRTVKWLNQHVPFVNIRMTGETIEGVSGVWLDTMDMEAAIDARKPARVADLYAGEFLEGFESGAHAFDEWANKERGRLKRAWDHAMSRAAREAEGEGKWRTAAAWWKIVVTRAPMRAEPIAHLLEAYARTGRREEANQLYSDYTDRLSRSGVAEVAGTVRQVVARYPLLQGIAGRPHRRVVQARPPVAEPASPEGRLPDWSLEPAPAPSDAFELTFELPEIEIPTRKNEASSAQVDGPVADGGRTRATSPLSFHILDEPVIADFRVGSAREWGKSAADELTVETVAMSFEKIAARASDSDPSGGNGGSGTSSEDVPNPPEGFSENSKHDWLDGNGNSPARDVPADETPGSSLDSSGGVLEDDGPGPSNASGSSRNGHGNGKPESANSPRLKDGAPDAEDAGAPVDRNGAPRQTPGQASDGRDRDRDLYRATAAILAAFVDDDEEEDEGTGNGRLADFPTPAEPIPIETPEPSEPDPWADFSPAPTATGSVATEPPVQTRRDAFAISDVADAGAGSLSGETDRSLDGQTVLFDPSDSTEFDLSDLDMDEFELYGGQVTRVRHQVTSVRKPWGPVLRRAWADLSEWIGRLVGSLRAVAGKMLADRAASRRRIQSEPAPFDEPWVPEPAYEPSPIVVSDDSAVSEPPFPDQHEEPTPQGDDSRAAVLAPSTSQIEFEPPDEASVEWFDEWDDGAAVDEPYGSEVDVYAPRANRGVESPIAEGDGPLLRRYWYAPVGVILLAAAFAVASIGLFGGRGGESVDSGGLSLPKPSLPKVSIRAPGFIQTSISTISRLFSGAILEAPGEWVLVADLQSMPADDAASSGSDPVSAGVTEVTPAAVALALEADLMQARFFYVFPRGRALAALGGNAGGPSSGALSIDDAISLASSEGISAVIGGTLYRQAGEEGDSLALEVFLPTGEAVYRVSRRLSEPDDELAALTELSREVRRRLGEPPDDLEASAPIPSFLSENQAAVNAYAEAVGHFNAGRYQKARLAATAATRLDSTFAAAYYLLARSSMELGARGQGRTALRSAVETSDGTTERERLRILGDWLTLTGRLSDAALTYDQLFNLHRDDVGALRSQAVVQRLIGAPGGGLGNLRVAHTIDRYDWPSLTQTARYLGYRGSLPSVDSLNALMSPNPDDDSND